jgi:serine/threonine-protein kinase HipA
VKSARVLVHGRIAGTLEELERGRRYRFRYDEEYDGPPVSLALPVSDGSFDFEGFPPFFDGLLPEGVQLEALLRQAKIDASDYLSQIVAVGADLVGAVTVESGE